MPRIRDDVAEYGWHATAVGAGPDTPAFMYTTGLGASCSHPEVIVFGLDAKVCHRLLTDAVDDIRSGQSYASPGIYEQLLAVPIAVRVVHPSQHCVYFADTLEFYRQTGSEEGFAAIQLFWPDRDGTFPFEAACDPGVFAAQPRLDLALPPSELEAFLRRNG